MPFQGVPILNVPATQKGQESEGPKAQPELAVIRVQIPY